MFILLAGGRSGDVRNRRGKSGHHKAAHLAKARER
jgi:hypothetical protein